MSDSTHNEPKDQVTDLSACPTQADKIISIDETKVKSHLDTMVRSTVEEMLNGLLDAEADAICNAKRYERSPERLDTRAGSYNRKLHVTAGEVNLKVPKLRTLPFESAVIQRYRRRECSVEEALVEMYLAGVSVRRVEDITEALWGTRVSPSTISNLNKKVYGKIEEWRNRSLKNKKYIYVYLDGIWLKRSWGGEVRNLAILVAVGVDQQGYREVLGVCEGAKEDEKSWLAFLKHLKTRGLEETRLFISDKCLGLVESLWQVYPLSLWQRCMAHFYRNVFSKVPKGKVKRVAGMLKAIHAQEDLPAAREKYKVILAKLREMKLSNAAKIVEMGIEETLTYFQFPSEHWRFIRTNNMLERVMKDFLKNRRRTRVVGAFPDGHSALMLTAARLRHVASSKWGLRRYMSMVPLYEQDKELENQKAVG